MAKGAMQPERASAEGGLRPVDSRQWLLCVHLARPFGVFHMHVSF